jgi:hypothetical protein
MCPALHCFGLGIWCLTPFTTIVLVEEAEVPGENHRPTVSHWQTLSPEGGLELTTLVVIGTDYIGNCNSSYAIRNTTAPSLYFESREILSINLTHNYLEEMKQTIYNMHWFCVINLHSLSLLFKLPTDVIIDLCTSIAL